MRANLEHTILATKKISFSLAHLLKDENIIPKDVSDELHLFLVDIFKGLNEVASNTIAEMQILGKIGIEKDVLFIPEE